MMSKLKLSIYLFFSGILAAALISVWIMGGKVEELGREKVKLELVVSQKDEINKQYVQEISDTRTQIATLSSQLAAIASQNAQIDINLQSNTLALAGMKNRFKAFTERPALTGKLVNNSFTKTIHAQQCLSGDKTKCAQ